MPHWDGGTLGNGAVTGLRFVLGALGYVVPAALVVAGGLVLARELRPPGRPLRTGRHLPDRCDRRSRSPPARSGVGPGRCTARSSGGPRPSKTRGGVLGQAELWVTSHLISTLGADILAVFLFAAGLILVTGATLAGVIRATGAGVAGTTRVIRRSTDDRGGEPRAPAGHRGRAGPVGRTAGARPGRAAAPARARHVGADRPQLRMSRRRRFSAQNLMTSTSRRYRRTRGLDLDADDEDEDVREPVREVDAADLTPQGRYRAAITDDPDFVWRVPRARFLTRATGEAAKPDTAGQEQVAATLIETLGHFGIEAKVIGRVTGPHITRYELRLAPGTKVAKVAQLKDDLAYALAATEIRILAPIPGKQAVGVEVPNARRRIVHLGDVFQEPPARLVAADGVARQGHRRPRDRRRPGQDAPPARRRHDRRRASRRASTRCCAASCCGPRRTRCGSCSSTPSRSSSTTTSGFRTCSRRSSPARGWRPTRCRTWSRRWSSATGSCRWRVPARCLSSTVRARSGASRRCPTSCA